jgi:hypothetical protein
VVSGRRRQGKAFPLEAACRAAGGFSFGATEAAGAESLRRISASLTAHARPARPFHFAHWSEAVDALPALGAERPVTVVIDGFPYLARADPELPSISGRRCGRCVISGRVPYPAAAVGLGPVLHGPGCCRATLRCAGGPGWTWSSALVRPPTAPSTTAWLPSSRASPMPTWP